MYTGCGHRVPERQSMAYMQKSTLVIAASSVVRFSNRKGPSRTRASAVDIPAGRERRQAGAEAAKRGARVPRLEAGPHSGVPQDVEVLEGRAGLPQRRHHL